jgi:hypothetical protein
MSTDLCSICLEGLNIRQTHKIACGHEFHVDCIIQSLRKSTECPYCRHNEFSDNTGSVYDTSSWIDSDKNYDEFVEYLDTNTKNYNETYGLIRKQRAVLTKLSSQIHKKYFDELKKNINKFREDFIQTDQYKELVNENKKLNTLIKKTKTNIKKYLVSNDIEVDKSLNEDLDDYILGKFKLNSDYLLDKKSNLSFSIGFIY